MAMDFPPNSGHPSAPAAGELWPATPVAGQPQYKWDAVQGVWTLAAVASSIDIDKGDITVSGDGAVWTIDNGAVTDVKLANVPTNTIKGRKAAGSGPPTNLTPSEVTGMLLAFGGDAGAGGSQGMVPAPLAGDAAAGKVLGASGTWTAGGNVLSSGTPTTGQIAKWVDTTHIQGVGFNVVLRVFTATGSTTYTPTTGMQFAIIECQAGGGGGGGVTGNATYILNGGGGGSGGYSRKRVTAADIGVSKTVTINAGGGGGAGGSASTGAAGGSVSVGSLCSAAGGGGGVSGTTGSVGTGGPGAAAGVGDVAAGGSAGGFGVYWASPPSIYQPGGNGGSSQFGGGGRGGLATAGAAAVVGGDATGFGAGGGGASSSTHVSNANGGNGTNGMVIITEFCL